MNYNFTIYILLLIQLNVWKWQVNCIHQEKTMLLRTVFSYFMQRFWFLLESAVLFPGQAVINW